MLKILNLMNIITDIKMTLHPGVGLLFFESELNFSLTIVSSRKNEPWTNDWDCSEK